MRRFKTVLIGLSLVFFCGSAFAIDSVYNRSSVYDADGWSVYVDETDVGLDPEIINLGPTFTQMASEDQIEVLSEAASDVEQTVTLIGIDNNGRKVEEDVALSTVLGTNEATSNTIFRYLTEAILDKEATGTVIMRVEGTNATILEIATNTLASMVAQHFNGEKVSYVTGWSLNTVAGLDDSSNATDNTVSMQLRWYPDDADSLDDLDGYQVVSRINTSVSQPYASREFQQPIKMTAGGWIAIYGNANGASADISVTLEGYDSHR